MSITSKTTINELITNVSVDSNGNVIIQAKDYVASILGEIIDRGNVPNLLASISGDNTILLIPTDKTKSDDLLKEMTTSKFATEPKTKLADLTKEVVADSNGNVIVKAVEYAGSLVGELIDQSNLSNVAASLSGDNTILVIPTDKSKTNELVADLNRVLK
ncbi:MAG: hypothetical protein Ta2D_03890 [Rickettsiales bacterium]|nr:MAG: hypothetical protein Ta2D_03890 [Rickettsiales bacterium]